VLIDHLGTPLRVTVPGEVAASAALVEIGFRQSEPFRPSEFGTGDDDRLLGLQLYSLRLAAITEQPAKVDEDEPSSDAMAKPFPDETSALPDAVPATTDEPGEPLATGTALEEAPTLEDDIPGPRGDDVAAEAVHEVSAALPLIDRVALEAEAEQTLKELVPPLEVLTGEGAATAAVIFANWYDSEGNYRWSAGAEAALFVHVKDATTDGFGFEATVSIDVATPANAKTVEVLVNGQSLARQVLADQYRARLSMFVPPDIAAAAVPIEIRLVQREPFRPSDFGPVGDHRLLGLRLYGVKFLPKPEDAPPHGTDRAEADGDPIAQPEATEELVPALADAVAGG
jgi:hypothetical protein